MKSKRILKTYRKGKMLEFNEIELGMRVIDYDGNIGTVKEIQNEHNILVHYDNGGSGLHCTVKACEPEHYYDPLFIYETA